jgi:hypothetical protein
MIHLIGIAICAFIAGAAFGLAVATALARDRAVNDRAKIRGASEYLI